MIFQNKFCSYCEERESYTITGLFMWFCWVFSLNLMTSQSHTESIPILSLRLLTLLIFQLSILDVIIPSDCGIK